MVLGVFSKLTLDAINKGLGLPEVFLEKGLELWPCDWSSAFMVALVLDPSKTDSTTKKSGGKQGIIYLCGA